MTPNASLEWRAGLAEGGVDIVAPWAPADVIVVDLRGTDDRSALVRARRGAGTRPLLILLESASLGRAETAALLQQEAAVLVAPEAGPAPVLAAIRRAVAQADRAAELTLRLRSMALLGLANLPSTKNVREGGAVLLATPGPRVLPILNAPPAALPTLSGALSRAQVLHSFELGAAGALLILADINRRPQAALARLIRRHAELSNLPIIALEPNPGRRHHQFWQAAGVDMVIAMRDLDATAPAIARMIRSRRFAGEADGLLATAAFNDAGEPSRLAAPRFFDTCLAFRAETAGPPFALGALRLMPDGLFDARAAMAEAAVYAAMAMRPIDLVTRAAPDVLVFSFAATDRVHALRAMQSVERLVQDLKFGRASAPVTFTAASAVVAGHVGDDPSRMLADLMRGLAAVRPENAFA